MVKTNKSKKTTKPKKAKVPKGIRIHSEDTCSGKCPFHNPSNHRMVDWKINIRFDRDGLVERICPEHGIGHPDPDSQAYFESKGYEAVGIHGCCGCCVGESY